jgi:predicted dehydrogenase
MNPIKTQVAVVGVGALGEHHARIYSDSQNSELVAVVDVKENRAATIAKRHNCQALSDYRNLPASVTAVSLAVPTVLHSEIGCELLGRGTHVLVEKPVAHTVEAADQLIEASEENCKVLHVGHSERFNPAILAARPLVTTPRFFEAHRLGVFVPRSLDIDVVLDLMIHDLDLILHLVDSPIADVRAVGIPVLTQRIDIANARIEFENGCVANITASRVSAEKTRKLRFFQPNDYVSIDFQKRSVTMYSLVAQDPKPEIIRRQPEVLAAEPLRLEIDAFLDAVSGRAEGAQQGCSGTEGKKALALAMQLVSEMDLSTTGQNRGLLS